MYTGAPVITHNTAPQELIAAIGSINQADWSLNAAACSGVSLQECPLPTTLMLL
jgi:hypothetical protein